VADCKEGSLTGFMALVCLLWLPHAPSKTKWFLTQEQKSHAVHRMEVDSALSEKSKITRRDIIETFKDWKLWYVLIFNILASVPPQAFGVFLPLVVEVFGQFEMNLTIRALAIAGSKAI
jgi:hypothetical protein